MMDVVTGKVKFGFLMLFVSLLASGCASRPKNIGASYVSPVQYQSYTCDQIEQELARVTRRGSELYGTLDKKAGTDAMQMGVGLVLFWPTLFLLEGGDGPEAQEYARLKGEKEALEKIAIKKNCDLEVRDFVPSESTDSNPTTEERDN